MPFAASTTRACRAAAILVLGLAITVPASAADDGTAPAYRMAYQGAMKCFVANGVVVGDARDAKNSAKAAAFDAKGHESFDLAHLAGQRLGLSQSDVNEDIKSVQSRELPKMLRDSGYFKQAVADCRALGLM